MKLWGTVAHNRCTVMRLAKCQEGPWASSPNPEHRSSHSVASGALGTEPGSRTDLLCDTGKKNHLTLPTSTAFVKCFCLQDHHTVSSLVFQDMNSVQKRAQSWDPLCCPAATPAGKCWIPCTPSVDWPYLCASTQSPNPFSKVLEMQKTYNIGFDLYKSI